MEGEVTQCEGLIAPYFAERAHIQRIAAIHAYEYVNDDQNEHLLGTMKPGVEWTDDVEVTWTRECCELFSILLSEALTSLIGESDEIPNNLMPLRFRCFFCLTAPSTHKPTKSE